MPRVVTIALIWALALYLGDLSLKATERFAHDVYTAMQIYPRGM